MVDLIPVDHDPFGQPQFIPIDHDPFSAQGLSPADQAAMSPETFANPYVRGLIDRAASLPRRALENAQYSVDTGNYDPGPTLEAATLPMGTGAIAGVPMKAGETVLGAGPIRAYHGSPHDFDAFDLSKIGTGEGAQAYGHGLYFAENPETAQAYRNTLEMRKNGPGRPSPDQPESLARSVLDAVGGDPDKAVAEIQSRWNSMKGLDPRFRAAGSDERFQAAIDAIKRGQPMGGGRMYEANINANPEHFLDWDAPLKDQPHVLEAAQKMGPDVVKRVMREKYSPGKQFGNIVANEHLPLGQATDVNISAAMRDAGIPGIKYLDAGSRAAGGGSRNYVVFNHDLINIVRKYAVAGIALPPAIAAEYAKQFQPVDHDPFAQPVTAPAGNYMAGLR